MRKILFLLLCMALMVGCGYSPKTNSYSDLEDSAMVVPDDTGKYIPIEELTHEEKPSEQPHENKLVPTYTPEPKSDEYEEGYHKGYADGEEDGYTHSEYQCTYNSSNDYSGSAAEDYEKGYADGYENGYNDNVEYDE